MKCKFCSIHINVTKYDVTFATWSVGVVVECKAGMLVVADSILGRVKNFFSWSDWKPFSTFKRVRARARRAQI